MASFDSPGKLGDYFGDLIAVPQLCQPKVPHMPLTDASCKNVHCPEGKARERYADSGGLYLEALPAGGKHWRWKYRIGGKEKRVAIGTYPAVTLAQARQARDEARKKLLDGVDPVQSKLDARLAVRVRMGTTFEGVTRVWFEHWRGPKTAPPCRIRDAAPGGRCVPGAGQQTHCRHPV